MKKILLLVTLMAFSIGFSQDKPITTTTTTTTTTVTKVQNPSNLFGKNEFKINALFLVLGAADLQYERILNEESSVGARILVTLDDEVFTNKPFYLDGFYRFYFGEKPASGFFVEGLASYNSLEYETSTTTQNFRSQSRFERESGFGLGIQVGGKFVTRRGLLFEINGGIGRNIIQTGNDNEVNRVFGRFAISVGYRF